MQEKHITDSTRSSHDLLESGCSALRMFPPLKSLESWYSNVMYTSETSGRQPGWKNQGRFPLQELKCKSSILSPTVHSCHCHLPPSDVCQRSSKAERAKLGSPVSVCHWPAVFASDPPKRDGRHLYDTHHSLPVCRLNKKQNVRK